MKNNRAQNWTALLWAVACAAAPFFVRASETLPAAPILKANDPNWKLDFKYADLLAVQEDRRKKPLQSHALETIEQMCGRPLMGSTFIRIPTGEPVGANEEPKLATFNSMDLYLSIWFFPAFWEDKPLILVSSSELRKMIAPNGKAGEKRVSIKEILACEGFKKIIDDIREKTKPGMAEPKLSDLEGEAKLVYLRMGLFRGIQQSEGWDQKNGSGLSILPHHNDPQGAWVPLAAMLSFMSAAEKDPSQKSGFVYDFEKAKKTVETYENFKAAYMARDPQRFLNASRDFKDAAQALSPSIYPSDSKLQAEVTYNNLRPFAIAWIFYLLAGIVAVAALRTKRKQVYVAAFGLYVTGLALHVFGFVLQIGRAS